jgi:hypothetical protein
MAFNGWRRPTCQEHEQAVWVCFTLQVKMIKRFVCITSNCATKQLHRFWRATISKLKGIVECSCKWGRAADSCCVVSLGAATSVLCTALLQFTTELRLLPHTGEITPQWMFVRGRVFVVHNCRRHTFRAHAEIMSSRTSVISIPLSDSENRIVLKLRKSLHGRSFWCFALQSGIVLINAGT